MAKLPIKYFNYESSPPPRPIRMSIPGWGGDAQKPVDGSEPQPWHCLPFTEGSTYGLELVYPHEMPCAVVNDDGRVWFDWDFAAEPGGKLTGAEFVTFFPKEASKYYVFHTPLNVQAPPGYVLRTEPHPRFFTDDTGTVPMSLIGNVQTEWWPRRLFVAFRAPRPGQRHVFRKGEPYAQVIFVEQRAAYDVVPMTPEEEARRRELEAGVTAAGPQVARNAWRNPVGFEFDDHYKVLARAFGRDGTEGVEDEVARAVERHKMGLPHDKPIDECLRMAGQFLDAAEYVQARTVYLHVLEREPDNAEALCKLGVVAACTQNTTRAMELMSRAVALEPRSAYYQGSLGELLRWMGRYPEAEAALLASLRLNPNVANVLSSLALVQAELGRFNDAVQACRRALALEPNSPVGYCRMGQVLARAGQPVGARTYFETALKLDSRYEDAAQGLRGLDAPATGPG